MGLSSTKTHSLQTRKHHPAQAYKILGANSQPRMWAIQSNKSLQKEAPLNKD